MIFNRFFGERIPVKSIPPDEKKREEIKPKKRGRPKKNGGKKNERKYN